MSRFSSNLNIYGNLWETVSKFKAAREKKNVMPYPVKCCKTYATVSKMADVFGEYVEPNIF